MRSLATILAAMSGSMNIDLLLRGLAHNNVGMRSESLRQQVEGQIGQKMPM